MRKVVLFIAASLDGYIADQHGNVDWLKGQDMNGEEADSYSDFIKRIDTVIMGWNTYHQITTELSPDEWAYTGLTSYVITHNTLPSQRDIIFTDRSPSELVSELKKTDGKDIWICGGANLVQQLAEQDAIDEYYISVIPTILGTGIRLFEKDMNEMPLNLTQTRHYNGIVELVYERRRG